VFLTDIEGFHHSMGEDAAPLTVASDSMRVMETLMLFTPVRLAWHSADKKLVSDPLFRKDGSLTLRGQYSKLVEPIPEFLHHANKVGRPVHIVGQEKTGSFVDQPQRDRPVRRPERAGGTTERGRVDARVRQPGGAAIARPGEQLRAENELG
jgi:hypothetical protein